MLLTAAGGGLALLGATPAQTGADAAAPPAAPVAAQAALPPAVLPAEDRQEQRASRSRRSSVEPEPAPTSARPVPVAPAKPVLPVLPGCDGRAFDLSRYSNGRLPASTLCALPGDSGERLRADAAVAFVRLATAYQADLGTPICVTDGYRTLGEQQVLRRLKPRLAARPGTSEHGWGLAVDLACGVQSFRTPQHAWMVGNAGRYGWHLPAWAQRGGARPEPWHWEYAR